MSREEMINSLRKIDVCARPTVATEDMGLQYDYATSEGAGTGFGGMGDWPVHLFHPIIADKWNRIRLAIKNGLLSEEHLRGTELFAFVENINTMGPLVLSEVLHDLLTLPEVLEHPFYCFFDQGKWYTQMDNPRFYLTEQEAKRAFISEYVFDVKSWENMDDDEIKKWYDLVHGKMSEFPAYSYDVDE